MAAPYRRKPFSPAFVTQTREVWQGQYAVPLTEEDVCAITGDMVEFVELLMKWDRDRPGRDS